MSNLGDPKIDLSRFFVESAVHEINGRQVNPKKLMDGVSMITMKIDSENVDHVRYLTTEGLSKKERIDYIKELSDNLQSEIFEMSTCNRVLYVGFGLSSQELEAGILETTSLTQAPFDHYSGMDVWRHLVKVCSGLDSFIIGELQVMSQFRGAVAMHRKQGLVGDINSSFFDHVISANRAIRRQFGFNQTTESMLNLATSALEEAISSQEDNSSVVLGFGDMGRKAVEVLLSLGQKEIYVVTRSPEKAIQRNPSMSESVEIISFDEWNNKKINPNLIISTIRNSTPKFSKQNPIPEKNSATLMDFSWPPSIEKSGVSENQQLYGMEHWIRVAHRLGVEWDYTSILEQSDEILDGIEEKFMSALTDRSRAKFRAYMYRTLESLSEEWERSEFVENSTEQMGAFSREIATWICNQEGPFTKGELENMMMSTSRPINSDLLKKVASDVNETVVRLSEMSTFPGDNS